jgi:hypothetical protein
MQDRQPEELGDPPPVPGQPLNESDLGGRREDQYFKDDSVDMPRDRLASE